MGAALPDAGAVICPGDHAEDDPAVVPGAEVAGVGVYLLAPHTGEGCRLRPGKQPDTALHLIYVVGAGQLLGLQFRKKGNGGDGIPAGEGASLQQNGFQLHQYGVGFLELLEKAEVDILAEHRLAVIVRKALLQRIEPRRHHGLKGILTPQRFLRISDLQNTEGYAVQGGVFLKLQHGTDLLK